MHHYSPGGGRFVGDCMPFAHDGVFHLYYLIDEGHHRSLGGLGGHQWAHASTRDLRSWTHHPLALAIEHEWEGSICTGSVIHHAGLFHAFYATRWPDWTQRLGHAVSEDGIQFRKQDPNPLASPPPGYSPVDFRDPFVFAHPGGGFRMLVTACRTPHTLHDRGGCLYELASDDLWTWREVGPTFEPGGPRGYASTPECPDRFAMGGRWYTVYGRGLHTHVVAAEGPDGPWHTPPDAPALDSRLAAVMKTAAFGSGRRIGAAWVPCREGDRDGGGMLWGGSALFREILPLEGGGLGTGFVAEMMPPESEPVAMRCEALAGDVRAGDGGWRLESRSATAVAALDGAPANYRLRVRVVIEAPGALGVGVTLRGAGAWASGADLSLTPGRRRATLGDEAIEGLDVPVGPLDLDILADGDLIEACLGGRRCIVNRLPEARGERVFLICEQGAVRFEELRITEIPAA